MRGLVLLLQLMRLRCYLLDMRCGRALSEHRLLHLENDNKDERINGIRPLNRKCMHTYHTSLCWNQFSESRLFRFENNADIPASLHTQP